MVKKLFKQFKYGQKGFTLIELLVVVAILGVLAAVAIPNVSRFIGKGELEALNTEVANLQTALTAYAASNSGVVPAGTTATDGAALVPSFMSKPTTATYTWDEDGIITAGTFDGYTYATATGAWTEN